MTDGGIFNTEDLEKEIWKFRKDAIIFQGNDHYYPLIKSEATLKERQRLALEVGKILDEWMYELEKKSNAIDFAIIGYKEMEELKKRLGLKK